jgi:8-oxo-dGTP pyrophosphatase MutT (NUDIX family)
MNSVQGFAEAVARYGTPAQRVERYQVSLETLRYWQIVTQHRSAEVIFALRRPNGAFAVQTKSFYPDGVYRLMTGGIKQHEDLVDALRREVWEETGQRVEVERFLATVRSLFEHDGETIVFDSYLFLVSGDGQELVPTDESEKIGDYQFVTLGEMLAVADQLESLEEDWIDWGRFRAAPHRLLVELLGERDG